MFDPTACISLENCFMVYESQESQLLISIEPFVFFFARHARICVDGFVTVAWYAPILNGLGWAQVDVKHLELPWFILRRKIQKCRLISPPNSSFARFAIDEISISVLRCVRNNSSPDRKSSLQPHAGPIIGKQTRNRTKIQIRRSNITVEPATE